jgi:carbon starvation protein CstA
LHVASAAWWILTSITIAIAGAVVNAETVEGKDFGLRVVPKVNRANAAAAAILLATGLVNVVSAGERWRFNFPAAFNRILTLKLGLYVAMLAALIASWQAWRERTNEFQGIPATSGPARLVVCSAVTAVAGAGAMMLGVWLAGE